MKKIRNLFRIITALRSFVALKRLGGSEDRRRYVHELSEVCVSKGQFLMMCLGDEAGEYPVYPNRYPTTVSQDEIRASFSDGWKIDWFRLGVCKVHKKFDNYSSWLTAMTSTK